MLTGYSADNAWNPDSDLHPSRVEWVGFVYPARKPAPVHRVWELRPSTPCNLVVQAVDNLFHRPAGHENLRLLHHPTGPVRGHRG